MRCIAHTNSLGFYTYKCSIFDCISYYNIDGELYNQYANVVINTDISPLPNKFAFVEADNYVNYNMNCNIDGATPGFESAGIQWERDILSLESNFNNPSNNDFTRTSRNLDDVGLSEIGMIAGVDYKIDIGCDEKQTSDYPVNADVRDGITYKEGDETGTLDLPSIQDVEKDVKFDNNSKTGEFVSPSPLDVKLDTEYGYNGEFIGSLVIMLEIETIIEVE